MKVNFLILLTVVLALPGCGSQQEEQEVYMFSHFRGNGEDGLHLAYSYDGLDWQRVGDGKSFLAPAAGNDKLMRDPCIIKGPDGLFHMVWTVSWNEKGIGYASSADLVNWSEQQYIPVMEHEPGALNCWAPEIFYDDDSEQYIIFWSTTIPGRFPETEDSGDNGYNHRMYYTVTSDFKTFSKTALFFDHGFNVIDGSLIQADGNYILFLKDETRYPPEKNIRIATSENLTKNYSSASEPITGDYWAEGPTPAKIGDHWVVYFDKYIDHRMGAVRSTDLVNWEDISDQIHFPEGTRHGTVFKVSLSVLEAIINSQE